MAAEKLRDLSQPIDVALLDATVAAFYGTGSKEEVGFFRAFVFIFVAPWSVFSSRGNVGGEGELGFFWRWLNPSAFGVGFLGDFIERQTGGF